MTQDVEEKLKVALAGAQSAAEGVSARFHLHADAPPTVDELAEVQRSGHLTTRLMGDLDEALKQIFVAGLAFPDPELPDELAVLAERAEQHGLSTAVRLLLELRAHLQAILDEVDLVDRQGVAARAWTQAQRLLAWQRMFRAEHDFLEVQARLAAESTGSVERRRVVYPSRTMRVWPVGIELSAGGKLVIFARDLDSELVVLLSDQLAEYDRDDPLSGEVISRLFQSAVDLQKVLRGVIRLEDHPVVTRSRALLFRPAFQATPQLQPVADNFVPPALPQMPLDSQGRAQPVRSAGPSRLRVVASLKSRQLTLRTMRGAPLTIAGPDETLRFNLTKLLTREGARELPLEAVLLPKQEALSVLSLSTDLDGVVFPCHDPSVFRLADSVLARRAESTRAHGGCRPVTGVWSCTTAYLLGGASGQDVEALTESLSTLKCRGLDEHHLAGQTAFLVQRPYGPEGLVEILQQTFELASLSDEGQLSLEKLAHVLGRGVSEVSPADLRLIDGAAVYKAIWLTLYAGLEETLAPHLKGVLTARYGGEFKSVSPGDVCARALLMALDAMREHGAEEITLAALQLEEAAKDGDVHPLGLLTAYLRELVDDGTQASRARPLPELREIYWYADTLCLLIDANRHSAPVERLQIARDRLAQACVDALYDWCMELEGGEVADEVALKASDAMLLIAAARLNDRIVC